ncbi:MAG TPA: hypothetical protein VJB99_01365 [Patescibacteria group bacterium]|nr:hypothetical protein [Patescibacteria group bacterium]
MVSLGRPHLRHKRDYFRRATRARYEERPFRNPLFPNRQKRNLTVFALAGAGIGMAIAIGSFLCTAPAFLLTEIRVEGTIFLPPREIRVEAEEYLDSSVWFFFHPSHRLFFREDVLRQRLERSFSFASLEIRSDPPLLFIRVEEKRTAFLWKSGEKTFLVDGHGTIIRELHVEETTDFFAAPQPYGPFREGQVPPKPVPYLSLTDLSIRPTRAGATVLTEISWKGVEQFEMRLRELGIGIRSLRLDSTLGTWMTAETDKGYDLLFDPIQDVNRQADHLAVVLREEITDVSNLHYVDLRFDDHVYYK